MNREEMYRSLYTHDTIYLPPVEQSSAALEVCLGCSWGGCKFCDFARDDFRIHSMERIEQDIRTLSALRPEAGRLFLLGENTFVLSTGHLLDIFQLVKKHMPQIRSFAMYARVDDVLDKSSGELIRLRDQGLDGLHIGLETGSDTLLLEMNKGFTAADSRKALQILDVAGIDYYVTIIPGLGGRLLAKANAIETARLLNATHPKNIWALKLKLWEATPLFTEARKGLFEMATDREILLEERLLLQELNVDDTFFIDTTVLNKYTLQGHLQADKDILLRAVNQLLQ